MFAVYCYFYHPSVFFCSDSTCHWYIHPYMQPPVYQWSHPSIHFMGKSTWTTPSIQQINPSNHPQNHPSVEPSIHQRIYLSITQQIHLLMNESIYPSVNPSLGPWPICPSMKHSIHPWISPFIYPPTNLSIVQHRKTYLFFNFNDIIHLSSHKPDTWLWYICMTKEGENKCISTYSTLCKRICVSCVSPSAVMVLWSYSSSRWVMISSRTCLLWQVEDPDHSTASVMAPSWKRLSSEREPHSCRNSAACTRAKDYLL